MARLDSVKALQEHLPTVDTWGGLAQYGANLKNQAAIDKKQERSDKEQSARDTFNKALISAPQDRSGWLTDAVSSKDIDSISVFGGPGEYKDSAGKALSDEVAKARLKSQEEFGQLAGDKTQQETKAVQLGRTLNEITAAGGVIPEDLRREFQQAEVAEKNVNAAREAALRNNIKDLGTEIRKIQLLAPTLAASMGDNTTTTAGGGGDSYEGGARTSASVAKPGGSKSAGGGKDGPVTWVSLAATTASIVSPGGIGPDASTAREAIKYMKTKGITPGDAQALLDTVIDPGVADNSVPSLDKIKELVDYDIAQKELAANGANGTGSIVGGIMSQNRGSNGPMVRTVSTDLSNLNDLSKLNNAMSRDMEREKVSLQNQLAKLELSPETRQDAEAESLVNAFFKKSRASEQSAKKASKESVKDPEVKSNSSSKESSTEGVEKKSEVKVDKGIKSKSSDSPVGIDRVKPSAKVTPKSSVKAVPKSSVKIITPPSNPDVSDALARARAESNARIMTGTAMSPSQPSQGISPRRLASAAALPLSTLAPPLNTVALLLSLYNR